jgi:hypothetical protein
MSSPKATSCCLGSTSRNLGSFRRKVVAFSSNLSGFVSQKTRLGKRPLFSFQCAVIVTRYEVGVASRFICLRSSSALYMVRSMLT